MMLAFIFDPHPESAEEIARVVNSIGLETKKLKTLAEFISALQSTPPRLIICEAIISGYDDFILLEYIKKDKNLHNIPVLITTNLATRENIIKARQLGANGFITKPFDKANLIKHIKLALDIRDLAQTETCPTNVNRNQGTQRKLSLKTIDEERLKSQIMQKIEEIPSLPAIVYKVMELVNSDKSSAPDFEKVVARDQALAARMLRMANSSFYSLSRKVSTISDAVVYLGHNTIRSLVLGASTSSLFKRSLPTYGYQREGLWLHANIVASLSREIAGVARLTHEEIENCYVAGLLHDIGKLILGPFAQKQADAFIALAEQGKEISEIEQKLLGFSHGEIGRILLDKWKLPRNLVETVHYHHQPEASTYTPRETLTVSIANSISNQFGFSLEKEKAEKDPANLSRRLQRLGLDPQWPQLEEERIRAQVDDVISMLAKI
ncbi:MAG: HDOD domain-containing protein [Deltaproteobacteria bacterium]|nr:HDOD domain-containing protein [Deltaproteobacteria bacterium]